MSLTYTSRSAFSRVRIRSGSGAPSGGCQPSWIVPLHLLFFLKFSASLTFPHIWETSSSLFSKYHECERTVCPSKGVGAFSLSTPVCTAVQAARAHLSGPAFASSSLLLRSLVHVSHGSRVTPPLGHLGLSRSCCRSLSLCLGHHCPFLVKGRTWVGVVGGGGRYPVS